MKKIFKLFLFIILMIPIVLNASTFSTERGNANTLLDKENFINTRDKYILYGNNIKYNYQNRTNQLISGFTNGGFISRDEYKLTIVRNNSYLFDGVEYWTLTESSSKYYAITYSDIDTPKSVDSNYKGRATEFIKNNVSVKGSGKLNDPWTFDPMYKVTATAEYGTVIEGNNTYVRGNCNGTECTAQIKIQPRDGYRYITNNCNGIYNKETQILRVSNVKRDLVCNVVFGLGIYKITLNGATPSSVYLKFDENFYKEASVQNVIRELTSVTPRTGYKFRGYKCNQDGICNNVLVVDEDLKLQSSAISKINDDVILEPTWESIDYTVTLSQEGATTPGTTSVTATYGSNMPTIVVPQKTGYSFDGYYTEANGGGTKYYNSDGSSARTWNLAFNKTLYAKWTGNTYTATFNKNGATSIGSTSLSCTVTTGSTCTVTAPSITRSGFTINGWSTNQNATSGTAVNSSITLSGNATYYAITSKEITITFNKNGNTSQTPKNGSASTADTLTQTCTIRNVNTSCNITSPTITRSGYTIIGYSTAAGTHTSSWDQNTEKAVDANATYFAQTSKSYSASFTLKDTNAATVSSTTSSCTAYNGASSCSITPPTLTAKTGYVALGWSDVNGGTTAISTFTSGNTYYSVTYNSNALTGTFNIQDTNAATKSGGSTSCYRYNGATSCSITAPTLTAKTGYGVIGWNTSSSATTSSLSSGASVTISSNTTYYSVTRKSYSATFTVKDTNACTADATSASCYAYNGATSCSVTAPTLTAKTGYTVVGWSATNGGTTTTTSFTSGNTYYSVTRATSALTGTFNIQDTNAATASATSATCYKYNGASSCTITAPTLTAKTGYSVVGWNTSSSATTSSLSSGGTVTISSNATYYSITKNNTALTGTFNIQDSNAATKSGGSTSCYRYNGATSCSITAPTLTAKSGYGVLGWNTSSSATSSSLASGGTATISSNTTYYSITRKSYSATFTVKDTNACSASATSASCYAYNGATSCSVTAPTLTKKGSYVVIGWSATNGGTTAASSFTSGNTYYSATYITKSATFTVQNTNTCSASGSSASCKAYNGASSCNITAPTLTAKTGYDVVGWNTNSSATTSSLNSGASGSITGGQTYYSITKAKTITVTLSGKTPLTTSLDGQSVVLVATNNPAVQQSSVMSLSTSKTYILSFDYKASTGSNQLHMDLYPDELPEGPTLTATTTSQHYDWEVSSSHAKMSEARYRFYSYTTPGDITISQIMFSEKATISYGGKYSNLPTPTRSGFTFAGWYTNGGSKVDTNSTVTNANAHTLHARWTRSTWTKKTYTCTQGTYSSTANYKGYSKTCNTVSQEYANNANYGYYRTCSYRNAASCVSQVGSDDCYYYEEFNRTGCTAWSSPTTETGLTSCTPSEDFRIKVECSQ